MIEARRPWRGPEGHPRPGSILKPAARSASVAIQRRLASIDATAGRSQRSCLYRVYVIQMD